MYLEAQFDASKPDVATQEMIHKITIVLYLVHTLPFRTTMYSTIIVLNSVCRKENWPLIMIFWISTDLPNENGMFNQQLINLVTEDPRCQGLTGKEAYTFLLSKYQLVGLLLRPHFMT